MDAVSVGPLQQTLGQPSVAIAHAVVGVLAPRVEADGRGVLAEAEDRVEQVELVTAPAKTCWGCSPVARTTKPPKNDKLRGLGLRPLRSEGRREQAPLERLRAALPAAAAVLLLLLSCDEVAVDEEEEAKPGCATRTAF